jgi:hypothetical protein
MASHTDSVSMRDLDVLVGTWRMTASLSVDPAPAAEASFEWLGDKRFLVQRWRVDNPDAPDGIAVIGVDPDRQRFTGMVSEDGSTITGTWELSPDGSTWEHDFDLTYTRTAQ